MKIVKALNCCLSCFKISHIDQVLESEKSKSHPPTNGVFTETIEGQKVTKIYLEDIYLATFKTIRDDALILAMQEEPDRAVPHNEEEWIIYGEDQFDHIEWTSNEVFRYSSAKEFYPYLPAFALIYYILSTKANISLNKLNFISLFFGKVQEYIQIFSSEIKYKGSDEMNEVIRLIKKDLDSIV